MGKKFLSVTLAPASILALSSIVRDFELGAKKGMKDLMKKIEAGVKEGFGSNDRPRVRTGYLRRSITSNVTERGSKIIGTVGSNVVYAAIHEFGGTISAKSGDRLRFQIGGEWVSVSSVLIPKREYIRPAIQKETRSIKDVLFKPITRELTKYAG